MNASLIASLVSLSVFRSENGWIMSFFYASVLLIQIFIMPYYDFQIRKLLTLRNQDAHYRHKLATNLKFVKSKTYDPNRFSNTEQRLLF